MIRSVVLGAGAYLPTRIVTNAELAERVDTSDEWIRQRTGIAQRHVAGEDEVTSDLAIRAAKAALSHAGLPGGAIDAVILATTTPDHTFPATATKVQQALGMKQGFAFDVQAGMFRFHLCLDIGGQFYPPGPGQARSRHRGRDFFAASGLE
jgi:3-oxoacyl-[acyl-carrier-protein] synthase III